MRGADVVLLSEPGLCLQDRRDRGLTTLEGGPHRNLSLQVPFVCLSTATREDAGSRVFGHHPNLVARPLGPFAVMCPWAPEDALQLGFEHGPTGANGSPGFHV